MNHSEHKSMILVIGSGRARVDFIGGNGFQSNNINMRNVTARARFCAANVTFRYTSANNRAGKSFGTLDSHYF